ncbi:MAG: UDP-glucose 4-epimerase, partial [Actinomycetota bacterium]|nr:UDP-glucose 4-epimerase [Actinomycetota bacterium]
GVSLVAQVFRRAGLVDFSPEQMRYLEHGRVADVSRFAKAFGWSPRPTAEAFEDFASRSANGFGGEFAAAAEQRILDALARRRTAHRSSETGAVGA